MSYNMSFANTHSGTRKHISLAQVKRLKSQSNLEKHLTLENSPSETVESPKVYTDRVLFTRETSPAFDKLSKNFNQSIGKRRNSKSLNGISSPKGHQNAEHQKSEIFKEYNSKNSLKEQPQSEETEKIKQPDSKVFQMGKEGRRNFSINSYFCSEGSCIILTDLAKSLHELNSRLIKSEEVTHQRIRENDLLKSKIRDLEARISEKRTEKLDESGIITGCNASCSVY